MGHQSFPYFKSAVLFVTDTDFSLWQTGNSLSLDASNENHLPTLINHHMYCCQLYFDL
jgi:hypothetical protein